MTVYEALMIMLTFGLLIVALLSTKREIDRPRSKVSGLFL